MSIRAKQKGFTLFEMILVISLCGFIFSALSFFYVSFLKNNLHNIKKTSILEAQLLSKEYLSRYIYNALPSSIKVSNDASCIEFKVILGSGIILTENPPSTRLFSPISLSSDVGQNYSQARYISFVNESQSPVKKIYPVISMTENRIGLDVNSNDLDRSAIILLSDQKRFCLVEQQIRFYNSNMQSGYEPVVDRVFSTAPFLLSRINDESLQLTVDLNFGEEGSSFNSSYSITVNHE